MLTSLLVLCGAVGLFLLLVHVVAVSIKKVVQGERFSSHDVRRFGIAAAGVLAVLVLLGPLLGGGDDADETGGPVRSDSEPYGGFSNCREFATAAFANDAVEGSRMTRADYYELCKGYESARGWTPR